MAIMEATPGAPTPGAQHSWPPDFSPGVSDQNPGVPGSVRCPRMCGCCLVEAVGKTMLLK